MAIPDNTARQFPWPAVQLAHVYDPATNAWVPQPTIGVVPPASALLTAVTVSAASIVVVPVNLNRRRLLLHNDSSGMVFVAFGPVSSVSLFTLRLSAQETYEGPLGDYTGPVSAVRASGTSPLLVTEIVT